MDLTKRSSEQLQELMAKVIRFFWTSKRFEGGRSFGMDWATMRVIAPKPCKFFDACRTELKRRANPT